MAGCYGNSPEDKMREDELFRYLDSMAEMDRVSLQVQADADKGFKELADIYYVNSNHKYKFVKLQDILGSLSTEELVSIAEEIIAEHTNNAGAILSTAVKRILLEEAEWNYSEPEDLAYDLDDDTRGEDDE
jgi:hypothetical protein